MNIKFFGDLEVGQKFTYIVWNGASFEKMEFKKTGKNSAFCKTGEKYFHYNDCIDVID